MTHTLFKKEEEGFYVTAFVGSGGRKGIQITIGNEYVDLYDEEILELAFVLLARYLGKEGYRATD